MHDLVIGIDPSLTGFGIQTSVRGLEIYSKLLTTDPKKFEKNVPGRARRYEHLVYEANRFTGDPRGALLLIEGYAMHAKSSSATGMVELGWHVRRHFLEAGATVVEVPPSVVKKYATGKGNASKVEVQLELAKRFPEVDFRNDNLADAYALVRLGQIVAGYAEPTNKAQREAAETVRSLL